MVTLKSRTIAAGKRMIRPILSPILSKSFGLSRNLMSATVPHYYLPIPDITDLHFQRSSDLVGLEISTDLALKLLDEVILPYKGEYTSFPVLRNIPSTQYFIANGSFMAIDGNVYYSLIRHYKPNRIIEIGSGNSTLLAAAAIRRNSQDEGGRRTILTCIEPFHSANLVGLKGLAVVIPKRVQSVPLSTFEGLAANDILFLDSSHVLRSGGDVWWEYCEILPRLKSGVFVHVHDVSLPDPYPQVYSDQHLYWTEQYVLQAFLSFNSRFEVIWPGNYLMTRFPERMASAFSPEYGWMRAHYPQAGASSLWMRVR